MYRRRLQFLRLRRQLFRLRLPRLWSQPRRRLHQWRLRQLLRHRLPRRRSQFLPLQSQLLRHRLPHRLPARDK